MLFRSRISKASPSVIIKVASLPSSIDATVGSIEEGKDATLIITEGDALDMRTSQVISAFIRGKEIDLNNKQKDLYKRFKTKYERQGK